MIDDLMNQNYEKLLKRITINPKVMAGKPVIKGTRLTVQFILKLLGNGTVKSSSEFTETISDYKSSRTAKCYIEFDGNSTSVEKYRVEVYMDDKLMDSIEKNLY